MKVLIIDNGIVTNSIECESVEKAQSLFPSSVCLTDPTASIGWTYSNGQFTPPAPPPFVAPSSVTMRQARLALLQTGKLADVSTAIASLPSPQKEAAQIEWEYSNEVQRGNAFVSMLGPALGLTEQQLDDLFTLAATL